MAAKSEVCIVCNKPIGIYDPTLTVKTDSGEYIRQVHIRTCVKCMNMSHVRFIYICVIKVRNVEKR
jgi:hypothetical protein